MIGWVFFEEPYIENLIAKYRGMVNSKNKFYIIIITFMQVLSCFLLFSAIPIMYRFINKVLKNYKDLLMENFKSTAILRGFALSMLWLISSPTFTYAIEKMHASIWISVLQGFGVFLFGSVLALIFSIYEVKEDEIKNNFNFQGEEQETGSFSNRIIYEFTLLIILFFGFIIILKYITAIELMIIIPVCIFLLSLFYFIFKGKIKSFGLQFKNYFYNETTALSYQLCLMLSAGLFVYALKQTQLDNIIVESINSVERIVPIFNILSIIPIIAILLGLVGLGPLTSMVLLTGILGGMDIPYPMEAVVLSLTLGNAIAILVSPLVMPVVLLSNTNGMNLIHNGFRLNWKYVCVLYISVQIYLQITVRLI